MGFRWRTFVVLLAVTGAAALPFAVMLGLDWAFAPNLTRYEDRSVEIRSADGRLMRAYLTGDDKWRLATAAADVDPNYLAFLKAYEDRRFERHWGVDPAAVARAAAQAFGAGHVVSGASTLSMQAARLLEPGPRTLAAKARQAARAVQLEWRYSKDEILGIYLTLAPFGGNIEGVRAASLAYFGKEPAVLTNAEAALLVALPQSPERLRPDRNGPRARAGRDKVLARLEGAGALAPALAAEARTVPVPEHRSLFPFVAPRLADGLKARAASGAVVRTTVDIDLQLALEALAASEAVWFPDAASMAAIVVENNSRGVVAYLGGLDFWGPYGQVDLARAVRSPGSALKPFIYGLAFDDLPLHPETHLSDRPTDFGDYAPQNFSEDFQGTVSVRAALQMSLNVPAVAVLDRLGPERLAGALQSGGARLVWPEGSAGPSLPMALGGVGIDLFDLAGLYVALANGGEAAPLRISARDQASAPKRILSARSAWMVTDILTGSPLPDGFARGRGVTRARPIAFKTGTSYGFRDAWSVGYSPGYTVAVWIGRPDGSARAGQFGRRVAAPMLMKIFDLLPAEPGASFPRPEGVTDVTSVAALPQPMRRFVAKPATKSGPVARVSKPHIAFPPDGAVLALGADPDDRLLELRVSGGAAPFRWLVGGKILPPPAHLTPTRWEAPGSGFVEFIVVDADGQTARADVQIRIEGEDSGYPK